nr:MAG TPA: hypothetical protein [Caudoviricetes sp.]
MWYNEYNERRYSCITAYDIRKDINNEFTY